jgi:PPIC-type PPIASE domain
MIRRWLREPLVHFLVLGALLFALSRWLGGMGAANRIVITPGQIDSLVATFTRTWQRPPTEAELKGLVDDHVRDELAAREAVAMGLDRDDTVIRRRLRQKLEFMAEDLAEAAPVTAADLQDWLDRHPDPFRIDPEVAFRQVFLSPDRRRGAVERDAKVLLTKLSAAGRDVAADIGDPSMLPPDVERSTRSSIARQFGDGFADEVLKTEPGRWAGPIRSGYGLHLVWVHARHEGRMPALDEVRPLVERELISARRRQQIDAMYERMLSRYKVVVERRRTDSQGVPATGDAAPQGTR